MEHLKMRWKVEVNDDGFFSILTDEHEPWNIATMEVGLPCDDTGNKTAHAIVDAHNERLGR